MKALNFAKRNIKELIRDPISLVFCIGLPLFLLVIFQQFKIPNEVYDIQNFTPGIAIFSFGFITLFTAQLIAKDRCSSLLSRLFASPMRASDYIIGYMLSLIPIAIVQSIVFFAVAVILGLEFTWSVILAIILLIPISILFISFGIFVGCVATEKQAAGLGSIIVQLVAFTSGMWFSTEMVGNVYKWVCKILPFSHSLDIVKSALNNTDISLKSVVITLIYVILVTGVSVTLFKSKMYSDKK